MGKKVFHLIFEVTPDGSNNEFDDIGGAFISCYLDTENEEEARKISKNQIKELGFSIKSEDECCQVDESYYSDNDENKEYYEQCLIDKEVFVINTWPEMSRALELLPAELLKKASFRGNEYAWKIEAIPEVIETARDLNLLNIGGQLQFRFPQATCECDWVNIDVLEDEGINDLPWNDRVSKASALAKSSFENIQKKHDFLSEGRKGFSQVFEEHEQNGNDPKEAMYFVWYLEAENQANVK